MKDNLRNNRSALESLFDDEFYHIETKGPVKEPETGPESAEQQSDIKEKSTTETVKMSKPCMVFLPGNDPSTQRNMVELWRKILAAVQLSPNKINILELKPGISVDHILEGNMGSPVIFWTGENRIEDLEGFPAYEVHENEDVAFVIADALPLIAKDRDLKVKLWSVLQKMDFTPDGEG